MPWKNVPKKLWPKMEDCVKDEKKKGIKPYKGHTIEESANAICYEAIMKKYKKAKK